MIDIILPTYNRSQFLDRSIQSVIQQNFEGWTLYIIDDGSTDSSYEIIAPYLKNPNIIYLQQKNAGVSAARNKGILCSDNPWVALLDSDDEWLPHKLEAQMNFIQANPHIKIVHSNENWIRNKTLVKQKLKHQKKGGWVFENSILLTMISPSTSVIHRDILNDVGLFNENFTVCEDYELWLRITEKYEVGFMKDFLINKYGGHHDQLSLQFFAMDYWRVKALEPFTKNALARETLVKKCKILLRGYKKHNNLKSFAEIQSILNKSLRSF